MELNTRKKERWDSVMEAFAAIVARRLSMMLKDCMVAAGSMKKDNGKACPVVRIYREDGREAVCICLGHAYWQFQDKMPLDEICRNVAAAYRMRRPEFIEFHQLHDFDAAQNHICFQMLNAERNKKWLKMLPHKRFHDLAAIYYVMVLKSGHAETIVVDHRLADSWKVSEEVLFKESLDNTRNLQGCFINRVPDQTAECAGLKVPIDREEQPFSDDPSVFYAMSLARGNGAAILLYEDVCKEFAQNVCGSFYMLPLGSGSTLLVPKTSSTGEKELLKAAWERNKSRSKDDFLSDSIYLYPADGSGIIRIGQRGRR